MKTKEEIEQAIQSYIAHYTVQQDPKAPMHFYSAYIDGKLYKGPKGKTVWTRKCDVVNSLKHNTDLFRFLRDTYEEEIYEAHPEFFDSETYSWQRIPWVKSQYRNDVNSIVNVKVDNWWRTHVQIKEVIQ